MGITIPKVDYYVVDKPGDLAQKIVGQNLDGAGTARYGLIKAVGTLNHNHEIVHVLALEIAMLNQFFDEGLASAVADKSKFQPKKDCKDLNQLIGKGLKYLMTPGVFNSEMKSGKDIYAMAQMVSKYWVEKFGLNKVVKVLKEKAAKNTSPESLISIYLEPYPKTEKAIKSNLQKLCAV